MGLFDDPYPVCEQVIVNLKGGNTAFRGVIWARRREWLVLRNVQMLKGKGESVPVDGEVAIPVGNVEFIQVVSG